MIKEYGAINGFTTETYETLHKDAVKNPYRASNKRQPTDQMIKTVGCDIYSQLHNKFNIVLQYVGLPKGNGEVLALTHICWLTSI